MYSLLRPRKTTLEVFNRHEIRGIDSKLINYLTENVFKNLSTNFVLIAVFVKVALEVTKTGQHFVLP